MAGHKFQPLASRTSECRSFPISRLDHGRSNLEVGSLRKVEYETHKSSNGFWAGPASTLHYVDRLALVLWWLELRPAH